MATPTVRRQIEEARTGAAPGIQKTTKGALLQVTFPLPDDIAVQAALAAELSAAQGAAVARRIEALAARRDAWRTFEAGIYGDASEGAAIDGSENEAEEGLAAGDA